jgi:protein-disulfide isomerase
VTLVEFFDYNCGYCKRSMPDVKKLIESDPKLRVVFKEFPILGPGSVFATRASIAAMKQGKFRELHEALFEFPGRKDETSVLEIAKSVGIDADRMAKDMDDPEVSAIIDRNIKLAGELGIAGTPAFVIGTDLMPGAVGFEALAA